METNTQETPTDVTTPSVETPATQAPTGSEAVTNTGTQDEQMVPFSRFQEVNNSLKETKESLAQYEQRLASIESSQKPQEETEIDPDVQKILDTYTKQHGFVSKAEIEAIQKDAELKLQVQQDVADLTKELNGFDYKEVNKYIQENGLSVNGKAGLRAAYQSMNYDNAIENAKKAAIAEFQQSGRTTGETSSSAPRTQSEEPANGVKGRIAATRQKLGL